MSLGKIAVGLVEPLYETNIGYVARCMMNFGLSRLIIVNPRCGIGEEARRYSMHGLSVLEKATVVGALEEVLSGFDLVVGTTGKTTRRLSHVRRCITPEMLARRVRDYDGSVIVLLGREDIGLTNDELEKCDVIVNIPANPEYPILNVSHAAAIIFYELYKGAGRGRPAHEMPHREEVEVLLKYFRGLVLLLEGAGADTDKAVLMLRRLIGGTPPTRSDVKLLLGVLRKAYESLSRSEPRP